ncbi:FAD dependent oxidoreductase [Linderina pennispora]|uniref:FAD dependent oxidoreductase n=1 Tax=Linderina pennispora TaxID=61395 RepID=A0A1Y1WHV0_9FUNG|nr:FAD dependent oxidoreductase [Linderina pennispora]ORX73099.1 FAD dependent oxidoreductase [Linderina pennispora]
MASPTPSHRIAVVVVGSGVIGLTTALSLQRTNRYSVTVVADDVVADLHGPHNISQDWASPFAGANWRSFATIEQTEARAAEEEAYFKFRDIARTTPEAGVKIVDMVDFGDAPGECEMLHRNYVANLQPIDKAEWPAGASMGYKYDSLIINVLQYLPWLTEQFTAQGGQVKKARLDHILDATHYADNCKVVVNCTAMGSRTLGGVLDKEMYPTRGQTLLVNAPSQTKCTYVIPRGDGTVILGYEGRYSRDASDADVEALRNKLIRVNVAFRPSRRSGPRLEVENKGDVVVLHNYGQSSFGYQSSWGYAFSAVRKLDAALLNRQLPSAKL